MKQPPPAPTPEQDAYALSLIASPGGRAAYTTSTDVQRGSVAIVLATRVVQDLLAAKCRLDCFVDEGRELVLTLEDCAETAPAIFPAAESSDGSNAGPATVHLSRCVLHLLPHAPAATPAGQCWLVFQFLASDFKFSDGAVR